MNIVLIGMSGAGKSTIGVLLAKALGKNFVDTDIVIQQQEGKLLQEIIDEQGVDYFLEIEAKVVAQLVCNDSIVATGGSVVYSERAMYALKQKGRIVYLHVPYEEIARRLVNFSTRGIVRKNGATLREIYEERLPLYTQYSDLVMNCSSKSVEQCVNELVGRIQ